MSSLMVLPSDGPLGMEALDSPSLDLHVKMPGPLGLKYLYSKNNAKQGLDSGE